MEVSGSVVGGGWLASGAAPAAASSLRMARKQTLVSSVTKSKHFPISILHIFPAAAAIFPSTFSTDTHFFTLGQIFLFPRSQITFHVYGRMESTSRDTRFIRRNLISSTWQTISRALVGLALGTRNGSTGDDGGACSGDRMLFAHAETVRSVPSVDVQTAAAAPAVSHQGNNIPK